MTSRRAVLRSSALLLALFAHIVSPRAQAQSPGPDRGLAALGIDAEAAALFAQVEPEFLRYQGLAIYGNTLASTQPAAALVDAEVELYRQRRTAGKLAHPDRTDAVLCFNLLLHRADVGREYLTSLVAGVVPGADKMVDAAIAQGAMTSGEWGEQFALVGLNAKDLAWRRFWARWLANEATTDAAAARLRDVLPTEADAEVRASLYRAQALLLDQRALPAMLAALPKEADPKVRTAIVFAIVEIRGRDALPWLAELQDDDDGVRTEIRSATEYLQEGTTDDNKHGFEIMSDADFVGRFGDLRTPAITWLGVEGLLEESAIAEPRQLDATRKAALFDALEQSLGFGLEAVKGSLFVSLTADDLPRLRRLRALSVYCPNAFTGGRRNTLMIMIRSLRARA